MHTGGGAGAKAKCPRELHEGEWVSTQTPLCDLQGLQSTAVLRRIRYKPAKAFNSQSPSQSQLKPMWRSRRGKITGLREDVRSRTSSLPMMHDLIRRSGRLRFSSTQKLSTNTSQSSWRWKWLSPQSHRRQRSTQRTIARFTSRFCVHMHIVLFSWPQSTA